jgi:hypothetical protein
MRRGALQLDLGTVKIRTLLPANLLKNQVSKLESLLKIASLKEFQRCTVCMADLSRLFPHYPPADR